jgi:hypothetical protein
MKPPLIVECPAAGPWFQAVGPPNQFGLQLMREVPMSEALEVVDCPHCGSVRLVGSEHCPNPECLDGVIDVGVAQLVTTAEDDADLQMPMSPQDHQQALDRILAQHREEVDAADERRDASLRMLNEMSKVTFE